MKKIIILTAVMFFMFTGLSFAAQKTIMTYMRAGDMGVSAPRNPDDYRPAGPGWTGNLNDGLSGGNNQYDSSGSYWYGGDSDISYCIAGRCVFGIGFRAYFEFTFTADNSADSKAHADGFGFAWTNGQYNSRDSTGGAPAGISIGELMGYAGPGRTDGNGLLPPKMMIEFDTYPNLGTGDVCSSDTRADPDNNNHIALMLWGNNITGNCTVSGTNYPKSTFDDNRHGAGAGTASYPYNSTKNDGTGGYYGVAKGTYNWLEDNQLHRFRLEVVRATAPVGGLYPYTVKVWVDCPGCTTDQINTYKDLTSAYTALTPQINRTVNLTAADHAAFNTMLFGWTVATGGATQTVVIRNFDIFFPRTACRYGTNPTTASYDYPGSSSPDPEIDVRAGTGCAWQAISNDAWITITGGASGTGNGTVTYTVGANTGAARTGTINIGDRIFTVHQAAAPPPPTCTLVASPNIVPYNSTTTLTWTITNGPADGTWSGSGNTCSNFTGSSGGSCTTAAQTNDGTRTPILTVGNAYGSNTCSTTFYVGCAGYTVYNNTGSRRDFRVSGSACRRVNNGNAIPDALNTGETVTRYNTNNTTCGTAQSSFNYTDAMNVDIVHNGGDGDCLVDYRITPDRISDR